MTPAAVLCGSRIGTRSLVKALLPFVVAQLAVLALVAAYPGILWRDAAEAQVATPVPGDEDALRRMLDQRDEGEAPQK